MNTLFHRISLLSLAGLLLLVSPVLAQEDTGEAPDIVDTAVQADGFDTLVQALEAAGLVEALKGEGPFTVFAPTDEAFAALGSTLDVLLEEGNEDELRAVLQYHVVSGKAMASDVTGMDAAETLLGPPLQFRVNDGTVQLMGQNSATVVQADIEASNGVIHVIDTVLLPPEDGSM